MLTQRQLQLLRFIQAFQNEWGVPPSFEEMRVALGLKSKSGVHRLISGLEERGHLRRLHYRARALELTRGSGDAAAPAASGSRSDKAGGRSAPAHRTGAAEAASRPESGEAPANRATAGRESAKIVRPAFGAGPRRVPAPANPPGTLSLPLVGRIAAGAPIEALADDSTTIDVPSILVGEGEHYVLQVTGDSMVDAGILDGDYVVVKRTETAENGAIVVALVEGQEVTLKRLRRRGASIALEAANPNYETRIFGPHQVKVQGRLVGLIRRY